MNKEDKNQKSAMDSLAHDLFFIFQSIAMLGFVGGVAYLKKNSGKIRDHLPKSLAVIFILFLISCAAAYYGIPLVKRNIYFLSVPVLGYLGASFFGTLHFFFLFKRDSESDRITIDVLKKKFVPPKITYDLFKDPHRCPVGFDLKTGEAVFMSQSERTYHCDTIGPSGQGKTTHLMTKLRHAIIHKHPVIFIDPKGSKNDIEEVQKMMIDEGRNPSELKVFSIPHPDISAFFNPLKEGTSIQILSKLMQALEFSNDYYKSVASQFLICTIEAIQALGLPMNFETLLRAANNLDFREEISIGLAKLKKKRPEIEGLYAKYLGIRTLKPNDLAGLANQLGLLCSSEVRHLISTNDPYQPRDEITVTDVIRNNWVGYFQLNALSLGAIGGPVGKFILQDLSTYSDKVLQQKDGLTPKFVPVFVDEFGSFAVKEFGKAVRIVRESQLSLDKYFQGTADLRDVDPQFEHHVMQNSGYKILFRQNVAEDAEKFSKMIGTIDGFDESKQTNTEGFLSYETGAGNLRATKKMRVEHDVFKNLSVGQAIFVDTHRQKQYAIHIINGRTRPQGRRSDITNRVAKVELKNTSPRKKAPPIQDGFEHNLM